MTEKLITEQIMRYLKSVPNCFAWKEHGGLYGTAGLPDIICCYRGWFVAFEVKSPSGKLTKLQRVMLQRINAVKGKAVMVQSVEAVKSFLETLEENPDVNSLDISR